VTSMNRVRRLRGGAAASAIALIALYNGSAMAQTTPAAAPAADAAGADASKEIVVTGTLFRSVTKQAPPVTVLTAQNLQQAAITNISDAVRSVAADGAGSIGVGFSSGFSAGGAAVSLRNLGVSSTLTLIDGLRSANFPLNDDGHNNYVDLNSIPMVNLAQVQVLKDGASSIYGADAIGGVVNLVTRQHMTGIEGGAEGGIAQRGDAAKDRMHLLVGYGDYASQGWNVYVGGDYEHDGNVMAKDRAFPFNTLDLRAIGGVDNNRADDTLTTPTTNAVVTRVTQTDLNNPLAGTVTNATTPALFTSLTPLANCPYGTFSENTSSRVGTACAHDLTREYVELLPKQERYDLVGRFSFRVSDNIEGYLTGSWAHSHVEINRIPVGIRQTQAFGGSPTTATSNPGIVLPVYICSSGVNCATAADRKLNPNNPYAAAYANDPTHGAARIYYLFGDVRSGSKRLNDVYRATGGLKGHFGDSWDWNIDAGYSRDNLSLTFFGFANLKGLVQAINTGSYNFVNPSLNTADVRNSVVPPITAHSHSAEATLDATISRDLFKLPGGTAKLAVGGQVRRETLTNNSANPNLDVPGLTTAQAYGKRTVSAGFFEIDAPVLDTLNVNASGRYDHYSTGFGRFSPKLTAKFQPIKQIALRGTYSEGFRAPTFAEADPRSSYSGFVGYTPDAGFKAAHPNNASYTVAYSLGRGFVGNPNIKPEISRSYTLGTVVEPVRWLTFTGDYFHVKKSSLIVTGPKVADAINAYYSVEKNSYASAAAASAAGCAALASVAPGYSCNVVDGADPFSPNALPRLLVLNAPYVNSAYAIISGLEFSLDARIPISSDVRWESRLDVQETMKYDLHPESGAVQRYAGTLGPEDLSSGNGTPRWRGNWQNSFTYGRFSLTATTYYVGGIKAVAADQASSVNGDTSCASVIYKDSSGGTSFCHIKRFIYTDLNISVNVSDKFQFYAVVGNVTDAKAPVAANTAYTTQPNYLTSWHVAGIIGRTFRAGANFKF